MQKLTSLSIFFPAYNEEENIKHSVEAALVMAPQVAEKYEIIVVNDASQDRTAEVVSDLAAIDPAVRLVSHDTNQGYGRAVKTGIQSARYDYIFFTDADCQFDLGEIRDLAAQVDEHDVVIGYRKKRMDSPMRLLNAKGWNLLNRTLFDLHVKDIDCAFKLMKREVVQPLELTSDGAMLSAELLIRLKQQGVVCKEVPVTHLPRTRGQATGAKPSVIARALREMGELFFDGLGAPTRQQLFTFGLIGVFNTALDLAIFFFLTSVTGLFVDQEITAKVLSFFTGVISSFALNSSYTFKPENYESKGFLTFFSVSLVGLSVNTLAFAAARSFGIGDLLSVLAAAACAFVVSFTLTKTWAFMPQSRQPQTR
jgi:putative flippase GtrA